MARVGPQRHRKKNSSVYRSALMNVVSEIQCVQKVAVHLGYGRVQLNCDGTDTDTENQI